MNSMHETDLLEFEKLRLRHCGREIVHNHCLSGFIPIFDFIIVNRRYIFIYSAWRGPWPFRGYPSKHPTTPTVLLWTTFSAMSQHTESECAPKPPFAWMLPKANASTRIIIWIWTRWSHSRWTGMCSVLIAQTAFSLHWMSRVVT